MGYERMFCVGYLFVCLFVCLFVVVADCDENGGLFLFKRHLVLGPSLFEGRVSCADASLLTTLKVDLLEESSRYYLVHESWLGESERAETHCFFPTFPRECHGVKRLHRVHGRPHNLKSFQKGMPSAKRVLKRGLVPGIRFPSVIHFQCI